MKIQKFLRIIFPILTLLLITFIYANSMVDATNSRLESDNLISKYSEVTDPFFSLKEDLKNDELQSFVSHLVRKLAHLGEFALLGILIYLSLYFNFAKSEIIKLSTMFIGLVIAIVDEYIQSFVKGRSSQVSDVILDFGGIVLGVLIIGLVIFLREKFKEKKQNKKVFIKN